MKTMEPKSYGQSGKLPTSSTTVIARVEIISIPESDGKVLMLEGVGMNERFDECCPMIYHVRFNDGHEHDVFEDELLTDPCYFSLECGPPAAVEIDVARKMSGSVRSVVEAPWDHKVR